MFEPLQPSLVRILTLQRVMDPASDEGPLVAVQYESERGVRIAVLSEQRVAELLLDMALRQDVQVPVPQE